MEIEIDDADVLTFQPRLKTLNAYQCYCEGKLLILGLVIQILHAPDYLKG